jgi:hypothetical protein
MAFDWTASDEHLHAACLAAIKRFAAEAPGTANFFALDAEPLYGVVWIAFDTNNVRVVQERQAAAIAQRAAELRRAGAWNRVPQYLTQPLLSTFHTDRSAFTHPQFARVDFPEWTDLEKWPELDNYRYLSSSAWLVQWRVAERLVAERAFGSLALASPFVIGCGIHDDEDGFRESVLRLLNWSAGT